MSIPRLDSAPGKRAAQDSGSSDAGAGPGPGPGGGSGSSSSSSSCTASSSASSSSVQQRPTKQQRPSPRPAAVDAPAPVEGAEIDIGAQLEVRWHLNMDDSEVDVWWKCTVEAKAEGALAVEATSTLRQQQAWVLLYRAMPEYSYEEERRTVAFVGDHMLIDLDTRREVMIAAAAEGVEEEQVEEGAGLMHFRREGESAEPPPLLEVGTAIKARWSGGDEYYAGFVAGINYDGTYAVEYADHDREDAVRRELIEVVEDAAGGADGGGWPLLLPLARSPRGC
jgi:hypothetical protein